MKRQLPSQVLWAACFSLICFAGNVVAQSPSSAAPQERVRRALPVATLNGFVENRGQWPCEVLFFAKQDGIEATLLRDALVFRPQPDPRARQAPLPPLVLRLPGASAAEGQGALPTQHHFIRGTGSASHVPGFLRVVYRDVLPGINIVVRTGALGFEYDLLVEPGADLGALVLEVEGAESLAIVDDDMLVMQTPAGRVEQHIGAAWQIDPESGEPTSVASRFRLLEPSEGRLRFGFEAPGRHPMSAFVLDPSLVYATYVGGSGQDLLKDMHVTAAGAVYLTARSFADAPTSPGAFQPTSTGTLDAWVGKLSPDGTTLEWGTFLGGNATDEPFGLDVDQDGTVMVVGSTWSSDFPTTPGSLQPSFGGIGGMNSDIFVSRLAADGSALVWSTFYGGPDFENAQSSALFPSGDVLLAGRLKVVVPPATPGAFDTIYDPGDKMLVRVSADGTQLVFQTFFKASYVADIVFDGDSNIYFAGYVLAQDAPLPATPGAFKEAMAPGDSSDAFVAKMNATGSQLLWATYLGGDLNGDSILGIAVDVASAVYVAGLTSSDDFPVTAGAFDVTSTNDGGDGFVAKLLPGGSGLVWSTFISACCGGSSIMFDLAVDTAGCVIAVGRSNEPNFPTTPDAFQPNFIGVFPSSDAHLTKFDAFGETLVYSTYFGGSSSEQSPLMGLDAAQDPHMSLFTGSSNIPVTPGAYDSTYAGGGDIVVAKFDLDLLPWQVLGDGLAGGTDTPNLAGTGVLTPGTPARISVRGAAPASSVFVIAGASAVNIPLKGGTLVPSLDVLVPLVTDGQGALDLPFTWLVLPAGIDVFLQVWIQDPGALHGWSASNALRMTSQ